MAGRIPSTGQIISDRGPTGLDFDRQELIKLQEADKNEIALDIAQFILDMTGIIDPTPVSDGTSAIISLTRGRWIDALISSVSIIPYIGDVAKLGKLPRYLKSIKKAVQISRRDQAWFFALKKLLIPLKKVVDQFYELSSKSLPGKYSKILREIKLEINKVVNNSPNGLTVKEAKAAMEAAENKLRPPRTKHSSGTTKKPDITKETSGKNSKIEGGVKNTPFKTHGLDVDPTSIPEGVALIKELKKANPDMDIKDVQRLARGMLKSGKEIPIVRNAKPDETLYKIVPKGDDVTGYTPYFTSKKQLDALKENPKGISDTMGLPKGSEAVKYDVYQIKPKEGQTPKVFDSKVASTTEGQITKKGGGDQTIVPNRPDWTTPEKVGES